MLSPHTAFAWQAPGVAAPARAHPSARRVPAARGEAQAQADASCASGAPLLVPAAAAAAAVVVSAARRPKRYSRQRSARIVVLAVEEDADGAPEPPPKRKSSSLDSGRVSLVIQRLTTMEGSLRRWGFVAEVVYTWLGLISLGVAGFAWFGHGPQAYRNPSMSLGLSAVGFSVLCSFIGWFQARSCRRLGQSCGLAASSLEPGGPPPPLEQLQTLMPSIAEIESGLKARQRTAWLGSLSAVVGLQAMVGLLVTKVLAAYGGITPAPGVPMDVFTLLAVSNSALSHVIGGGLAHIQMGALPPSTVPAEDPFRGWGRQ